MLFSDLARTLSLVTFAICFCTAVVYITVRCCARRSLSTSSPFELSAPSSPARHHMSPPSSDGAHDNASYSADGVVSLSASTAAETQAVRAGDPPAYTDCVHAAASKRAGPPPYNEAILEPVLAGGETELPSYSDVVGAAGPTEVTGPSCSDAV